ncbi:MAG: hypothetical protein GF331_23310 [Chitinivibrionales bacterium]|nr:hypothetical protein [Chitinivibrionales bacterium]
MRQSDLAVYYKVWFSFGLYAVLWLLGAMRFVNDYADREVYSVSKIRSAMVVYAGAIAASVLVLLTLEPVGPDGPARGFVAVFAALWALLLGGVVTVGYCVYDIAESLCEVEERAGIAGRVSPRRALVLFFALLLAFPYLQSHMNVIARVNT